MDLIDAAVTNSVLGTGLTDQLAGTIFGRWYVTIFGITFAVACIRHIGWKRTAVYAIVATAVGIVAENSAVRFGVPYTRYSFNESLRGEEIWVGDVPLMVSLSYTFMGYFAFATARLIASTPWMTRARSGAGTNAMEFVVAVMLSTWALWVVDPVSRLGEHFFLGDLFAYDGPGFWFGLPIGSQLGFTATSIVLLAMLTALARNEPCEPVDQWFQNPRWIGVGGYLGQVIFMAATAFVVARSASDPAVESVADSLAGASVIVFLPMGLLVAHQWSLRVNEHQIDPSGVDHDLSQAAAGTVPADTGGDAQPADQVAASPLAVDSSGERPG